MPACALDLPLITEATSDYYRNIYADPDLGPIFKGVNMVVLRTHVSYFIHQLTMFDTPMTSRQVEYLRKVHGPVIAKHNVTQRHYDVMLQYLTAAMVANGAEELHLESVAEKLLPLRNLFPAAQQSDDGHVEVCESSDAQATRRDGSSTDGKSGGSTAGSTAGRSTGNHHKPTWLAKLLQPFRNCTSGSHSNRHG